MSSLAVVGPINSTIALIGQSVRHRYRGVLIATVSLGAMLILAAAAYGQIDIAIYDSLPAAVRSTMGIPLGADGQLLAYTAMFATMGGLALAGVAISIGASSIAGEESAGRLGILLGTPTSRVGVLSAKAVTLVLLIGFAGLGMWAAGLLAPVMLGFELGETHVGAMALTLTLSSLFYGFLALGIGAATGNRGLGSGIASAVLVLGFVTAGILPLFSATEDLAKTIPWSWLSENQPLVNGIDAGNLALFAAGIVVFYAVGVVGLRRRDLRGRTAGGSLLDKLKQNPTMAKSLARLTGSVKSSSLHALTFSSYQGLLSVVAGIMFAYLGLLLGPVYSAMEDTVKSLSGALPEELLTLVGGADMSTPAGFYQTETLGLVAPIAVIFVGIVVSGRSIAGEETGGRLGLLLAQPISRAAIVRDTAVVMLGYVAVVSLSTAAGIAGGSLIGGLAINLWFVAQAGIMIFGLGAVFGGLALALSAGTGRQSVATFGTVGVAAVAYFGYSMLTLAGEDAWAKVSPFYYYGAAEPLANGANWGHLAILLGIAAVLVAAAFPLFQRRDLRR